METSFNSATTKKMSKIQYNREIRRRKGRHGIGTNPLLPIQVVWPPLSNQLKNISDNHVVKALAKFKAKKSPGPDQLRPVMLPHLTPNLISVITFLYKACIALHYTPLKWKEAKVVFIPKLGKESYNDPKFFVRFLFFFL